MLNEMKTRFTDLHARTALVPSIIENIAPYLSPPPVNTVSGSAPAIINDRCNYLRKIKSFREAGYDIVYMDETWVNQTHCTDYMWLPNDGLHLSLIIDT
jgi:hypothetical protein